MSKFKKGDRVRVARRIIVSDTPIGSTGTVDENFSCRPFVLWDEWGSVKGYPRWPIPEGILELIQPESPAKITMDGEYVYREGGKARILCVDGHVKYPVVSINDEGVPWSHTEFGEYVAGDESQFDLLPAAKMIEVDRWVLLTELGNVYRSFHKREAAERYMQKYYKNGCVIHVKQRVPQGHVDQE